ncbi:hypothetical protein [Metallibacterium sp.]|uniref:hypothetical protein n=1 Tax=Metallibacterium sp. TaxID=2940281 RepID=UPI0026080115|nr:hypothetical protein [Metallibacterium sp.]
MLHADVLRFIHHDVIKRRLATIGKVRSQSREQCRRGEQPLPMQTCQNALKHRPCGSPLRLAATRLAAQALIGGLRTRLNRPLSRHLAAQARTKAKLRAAVEEHIAIIGREPEHVKAYFRNPQDPGPSARR